MPALKRSVGIERKRGGGFQPLRRGKMPRPLFGAEPRNLADIVSRGPPLGNSSIIRGKHETKPRSERQGQPRSERQGAPQSFPSRRGNETPESKV